MIKIGDEIYGPNPDKKPRSTSKYASTVDRKAWMEFDNMLKAELKGVKIPARLNSELYKRFGSTTGTLYYKDMDDMVQSWRNEGWLVDKTKHAAGLGPSQAMGGRPNFDKAALAVPINQGENRRHVISASTLGRAVEKSAADKASINAFLERWGRDGSTTCEGARVKAWALINSNPHNLWPGEGANNQAAGFIRAPLKLMREEMMKNPEAEVTLDQLKNYKAELAKVHPFMGSKIEGNSAATGKERWAEMASFCSGVMDSLVDQKSAGQAGSDPTSTGITNEELAEIVFELEMNADLDLPDSVEISRVGSGLSQREQVHMTGAYFSELAAVYDEIRKVADTQGTSANDLFAQGGIMDRYMELNLREMRQISPADLNVTVDAFDVDTDDESMGLGNAADDDRPEYYYDTEDESDVDNLSQTHLLMQDDEAQLPDAVGIQDPASNQRPPKRGRSYDDTDGNPDHKHQKVDADSGAGVQLQNPPDRIVIDLTEDEDSPSVETTSLRDFFKASKEKKSPSREFKPGKTGFDADIKASQESTQGHGFGV